MIQLSKPIERVVLLLMLIIDSVALVSAVHRILSISSVVALFAGNIMLLLAMNRQRMKHVMSRLDTYHLLNNAIIQNADALVVLNQAGQILTMNPSFERIFQRNKKECLQQSYLSLFVAERERDYMKAQFNLVFVEQQLTNVETRHVRRDGKELDVVLSLTEVVYRNEKRIVIFLRDVTFKRAIDRQMKAANYRLLLFVNRLKHHVFSFRQDGSLIFMNEQAEWWLAAQRWYEKTDRSERLTPLFYESPFYRECRQRLGETQEWAWLGTDEKWYAVQLYRFQDDYVIVLRDIDELKRHYEERMAYEDRLKQMVESSTDAIFIVDGGYITYVNRGALRQFAVSDEVTLIGRTMVEFLHEEQWNDIMQRGSHHFETVISVGQVKFPAEIYVVQATLFEQPIVQVIVRDISARKAIEQQIRDSERQLTVMTQSISDLLAQLDAQFRFRYASSSHQQQFGYEEVELLDQSFLSYIDEADEQTVRAAFERATTGRNSAKVEARVRCADGRRLWMELALTPLEQQDGWIVLSRSIEERKQTEMRVKTQEHFVRGVVRALQQLLEVHDEIAAIESALVALADAIHVDRISIFEHVIDRTIELMSQRYEWRRQEETLMVNDPKLQRISYRTAKMSSWLGQLKQGMIIDGRAEQFTEEMQTIFAQRTTKSTLVIPILLEGKYWGFISFDNCEQARTWTMGEKSIILAAAASIGGAIEKSSKARKLSNSTSRLNALMENLATGILVETAHGVIEYMNDTFRKLFHLDETGVDWIGVKSSLMLSTNRPFFSSYDRFHHFVVQAVRQRQLIANYEVELTDGRHLQVDYIPIFANGRYEGHLWHYRDITERKQREEQLRHSNFILKNLTRNDSLTGVGSRLSFEELVAKEMDGLEQYALIFFDIDHFKRYNDYYGHVAGDSCLKTVAQVVAKLCVTIDASIIRYGGEEFMIVMPYALEADACQFAEQIRAEVERQNIEHEQTSRGVVTISVGVALKYEEEIVAVEQLIREADEALYEAKAAGRNRVVIAT